MNFLLNAHAHRVPHPRPQGVKSPPKGVIIPLKNFLTSNEKKTKILTQFDNILLIARLISPTFCNSEPYGKIVARPLPFFLCLVG